MTRERPLAPLASPACPGAAGALSVVSAGVGAKKAAGKVAKKAASHSGIVGVALLACLVAASCAGATAGDAFAFPFAGRAVLVPGVGPARFEALSGEIRPRDFAITDSGFIAWDRGSKRLVRYALDGKDEEPALRAEAAMPLEAAQVFASERLVLARSAMYEPGEGFSFSLYALSGGRLTALRTFSLDCFPADAAFFSGAVYWIGADEADETHTLYRADASGGAPRALLSFPKRGDFGRLVAGPAGLLAFASHGGKSEAPARLWYLPLGAREARPEGPPSPLELELPAGLACLYGDGLSLGGAFWLPCARTDGGIDVVELLVGGKGEADSPRFGRRVADSGGVYLPLADRGGAAWYLAFDYQSDPGAYALARFNGSSIGFQPLSGGR